MKVGNKNDRIDARKLSELLYLNKLNPVYHGEHVIRTLKELAHLHSNDARFEAGDESAEGHLPKLGYSLRRQQVNAPRYRAEWLAKISEVGVSGCRTLTINRSGPLR